MVTTLTKAVLMCLRSQGRIRVRAIPLSVLIGLAVMGSLIVWTKEGVYMKQKYASRFNAGKKSFLSLVIPSKHSMVCKKAHITSIVTLLLLAAESIHLSIWFLQKECQEHLGSGC